MKKILLIVSLLFATTVSADFNKKDWEFRSEITFPGEQRAGYASFDIPKELLQNLNSNLSDLRIISGETEVPFVLTTENEKDSLSNVPAKVFNISSVQGQSTGFIVDTNNRGSFHNRVTIETSGENFKRDVKIEGSDDQKTWNILNQDGQIFDYTYREGGYINSKFLSVDYPQSTYRYLRVTIFDRGELPIKVIGGSVQSRLKSEGRKIAYSPMVKQEENPNDKSTDIFLDLDKNGVPHSQGEFVTNDTNFSRGITVSESTDGKSWNVLGNGYIFSINTEEFSGKNLSFSYPESRKRYLKISILNRDDQPIKVDEVKLYGIVRKVLFKADADKTYYAYFGNPKARSGEYDLGTVSQYLNAENIGNATLRSPEKNPDFVPTLPPLSERSPYLLPGFLVLIVIILAIILVKLFINKK